MLCLVCTPAGAAAASAAIRAGRVGVHMVPPGRYCARVNSVQAFGEVNRDVSVCGGVRASHHSTEASASFFVHALSPSLHSGFGTG